MIVLSRRFSPLWRNRDFLKFWAADGISVFGSLITRAALPFTAIIALDASALQVALLALADLLPSVVIGLPVGVWVDRLRRRPLMIASDIARALVLGTVPLAALLDAMTLEQLYVVALVASMLNVVFNVAQLSFLPGIVGKESLLEANSKVQATQSVSEVGAFGTSGWLVQLLSGPGAIFIDACSFAVSALLLGRMRATEPPPPLPAERASMREEITEGLKAVAHQPVLRSTAIASTTLWFAFRVFGTVISLFAIRELGFRPGVLGMIYGVGGAASFAGALLAAPAASRLGAGPALIGGLSLTGLSLFTLPFAHGHGLVAGALLVAQQFGDGAATVYFINEVSLRQTLAPAPILGRVNATARFLQEGAMVLGIVAAGVLGETIGLRATLAVGAVTAIGGSLWLPFTPVRNYRGTPASAQPVAAGETSVSVD